MPLRLPRSVGRSMETPAPGPPSPQSLLLERVGFARRFQALPALGSPGGGRRAAKTKPSRSYRAIRAGRRSAGRFGREEEPAAEIGASPQRILRPPEAAANTNSKSACLRAASERRRHRLRSRQAQTAQRRE